MDRFDAAVVSSDAEMERISAGERFPTQIAREMVDMHRAILGSPELADSARTLIQKRRIGAEWAIRQVVAELRRTFSEIEDERIRARFEDVEAVAERLLRALLDDRDFVIDEQFAGTIAIGAQLSALEALELHHYGAAGFATEHGGPTSHATIVARALGVPYAFGVHGLMVGIRPAEQVWVDGATGEVVSSPDQATQRELEARGRAEIERQRVVDSARFEPAVTLDGVAVSLGGNVESSDEVAAAIEAGVDHIGLVRTELLYVTRRELPSEEEQYADALAILSAARGRPVSFRTLDLSDDKLPRGMELEVGPNPALGVRGLRLSLRHPELFSIQLRALYRAASAGRLCILFPMVSTVDELREARRVAAEVCRDLSRAAVAYDPATPLGAMIETPSAALTADHIAMDCDFLSVGTNDLIQYAFAADRQNEDVSAFYQPLHPAILRSLELIFSAARRVKKPVSLCGDMAGDPAYTAILLGLGLRTFSMPGRMVPIVKSAVRRTELAKAVALVEAARTLTTHDEVLALARRQAG